MRSSRRTHGRHRSRSRSGSLRDQQRILPSSSSKHSSRTRNRSRSRSSSGRHIENLSRRSSRSSSRDRSKRNRSRSERRGNSEMVHNSKKTRDRSYHASPKRIATTTVTNIGSGFLHTMSPKFGPESKPFSLQHYSELKKPYTNGEVEAAWENAPNAEFRHPQFGFIVPQWAIPPSISQVPECFIEGNKSSRIITTNATSGSAHFHHKQWLQVDDAVNRRLFHYMNPQFRLAPQQLKEYKEALAKEGLTLELERDRYYANSLLTHV